MVWGIIVFIYFIGFFHRMSVGAIHEDLEREFGLSSASLAAFGSIYFYVYTVMQIPAGILADTLGARKTVFLGAIVSALGSVLFGLAPNLAVAYAARFLVGLGVSVVFIPLLSINSQWFYPREFATITGMSTFVGNMGSAFAQTPLVLLATAFTWRTTFLGIGILTALAGVASYILVRNKPEDMGFAPIVPSREKKHPHFIHALGAFFKNPKSWSPCLVTFTLYSAQVTFAGTFGQEYFVEACHYSEVQAGNLLLANVLSVAATSFIFGWLSDHMGRRKPILVFCCVLNLTIWTIFALFGKWLAPGFHIVLMVLAGACCGPMPLCLAVAKEVNDPAYTGISTATANMFAFLGASFVPILFGTVLDHFRPTTDTHTLYSYAFAVLIGFSLIGISVLPRLHETHCANINDP